MAARGKTTPKQVVYLWGAGATQAEAQKLGAPVSLLMRDNDISEGITTRILRRLGPKIASSFESGPGIDIEKLISLLAASGTKEHAKLADKMRSAYFLELQLSLETSKVLDKPLLATQLLRMHKDRRFQEEIETLSGIITTNHDGLLQIASQKVFGQLNLGFKYSSVPFSQPDSNGVPPILQLHGSFTWQFGVPIKVGKLRKNAKYADTVWIPPTTLKEAKNFPFNTLSGLAYDLLARKCDVLRVVGASLTQNDWNVLSLIFNAQRHRESTTGASFLIELIMPQRDGEWIQQQCAYLKRLNPIGYLTEGQFSAYKDGQFSADADEANPLAYWIDEKLRFHGLQSVLNTSVNGQSVV